MAIFSKRLLQGILNQNIKFLSNTQLNEQVSRLNKGGKDSLSTEWELVILNTLSKLGDVKYEQSFGKSKPDLFFQSKNKPSISFLADITTVSDEGYEDSNPIGDFMRETFRILRKKNIKLDGFYYKIGCIKGKRSMMLKIPPKNQFNSFFKSPEFKGFIANIKGNPNLQQNLIFQLRDTEIKFYYNPQGKYTAGSYASYNTAHSLTANPIYNALKSKAKQLKSTKYKGILAIFLCDGGCNLLTSGLHDGQSYNLNDVIDEFFRQYSSIYFILIFSVKESLYSFSEKTKSVEVKIFSNPITSKLSKGLYDILKQFTVFLPIPVNTVVNAANKVSIGFENYGNSFYGGSTVKSKTIRLSARGLLELLSGKIDQKKFLQDHQFAPTAERSKHCNFFELKLNEGRLITNVRLEKSADKDDDWIIFEFGEPDPAVTKYKSP